MAEPWSATGKKTATSLALYPVPLPAPRHVLEATESWPLGMRLPFLYLWTRSWHTCVVLSGQLPQELLLPNLQTEQLLPLKGQKLIISLQNHHDMCNLPSVLVTLYVLSILRPHHRDGGKEGRQLIWTGCSTPAEQHCRRSIKHVSLRQA